MICRPRRSSEPRVNSDTLDRKRSRSANALLVFIFFRLRSSASSAVHSFHSYRFDLLLYHRQPRCLVVIDLKIGKFNDMCQSSHEPSKTVRSCQELRMLSPELPGR